MSRCVGGIEIQRSAVTRLGFLLPAFFLIGVSEVVVRLGIICA